MAITRGGDDTQISIGSLSSRDAQFLRDLRKSTTKAFCEGEDTTDLIRAAARVLETAEKKFANSKQERI